MTNRNATSVVFGWDFQVNAAIVIMLENIKELTSIRLEEKNEDIEIDLNDGSCILAQAKSVVRSSEDFTHVLDNLKKSLKSLSEAYRDRKSVKKLIYITNSPNPLSVTKEQFIFAGFPTRRKYESLPEKSRKQIDKILKNIEIPLDTSNLTIQTLPFETDDDNEKYKFVLEAIREFISQFNSNNKISKVNLHQVWTNDIFKSGSKKDTSLNLSKKRFNLAIFMDSKRLCTESLGDLVRGTNCTRHGNHRKYDYFIGYSQIESSHPKIDAAMLCSAI